MVIMKYKLVDYTTEVEEDVTLGTCDLCMSTGNKVAFPYFHIQDENGEIHRIPGFMWSWGDIFDIWVENLPHFAAWLEKQDLEEPGDADNYEYTYSWLQNIVDNKYNEYLWEIEDLLPWVKENVVYDNDTIRIPYNEKTRSYLNDYYFDQICRVLGIRTDKQLEGENAYRVISNDFVEFEDNVSYTTIGVDVSEGSVMLYFTGYDENDAKVSYPDAKLADSFGTIVFSMRGNDFPEVSFEKD